MFHGTHCISSYESKHKLSGINFILYPLWALNISFSLNFDNDRSNLEAHQMVSSREVDSKVVRMAIQLKYFYEKKAKWRIRNIRRFFYGVSSDALAFKFQVFASDFECWIGSKWILVVRHSKSILAHYNPLITLQGLNWKCT